MADINDINVIFDYYAALWKYFSRERLELLLDNAIEYEYFVEGCPAFKLYSKNTVLTSYYDSWFSKCQITSTKVASFDLKLTNEGIQVEYEVTQMQSGSLLLLRFRETFRVKSGKIVGIAMNQLYRERITHDV